MNKGQLEGKEYNAIYADGSFEKIKLGKILNKGGAAGSIYENQQNAKTVAKIYHDKYKSHSNRKKLEAMLHNIPDLPTKNYNGIEYVSIAWPSALLEDSEGFCVGYLMPKIDTTQAVSLDHFMQKAIRKKLNLPENYFYRVIAAYKLAESITAMHKRGHFIIDLKPSNIFIYKETLHLVIFDCDGFSILGEHERYPAEYVSEEYIYPEGMNESCKEMGQEQDNFALAVIIFKLLNNGIHPFSGTPKKQDEQMLSVQERIFNYHYAYGILPDSYQTAHPYSIHEYFHPKTMELFEKAFSDKYTSPSAEEWLKHLVFLIKNLKKCKKNPNHMYFTNKGCGLCAADEKFALNINSIKNNKNKTISNKKIKFTKNHLFVFIFILSYILFFVLLYKLILPAKNTLLSIGLGVQLIFISLFMTIVHYALKYIKNRQHFSDSFGLFYAVQVFSFVCLFLYLFLINNFSFNLFLLNL